MKPSYSHQSLRTVMHQDYIALPEQMLVKDALEYIRHNESKPRILYFYLVDNDFQLMGVVSTRALLMANLEAQLKDIADTKVRSLPVGAEVSDALTDFVVHKYLALPVVDSDKKLVGIVDVSTFTDNISDIIERDRVDEVFETIGFHLSQIKGASPLKAFSYRFPWLIASIVGGLMSALMTSRFENILASALVLSFFLTLILGLGESVSMQSMTVTIQALRSKPPSLKWFIGEIGRELLTAMFLGLACGIVVGSAVIIWRNDLRAALIIGGSLVFTLISANLVGLLIPTVLHALKLDPKIASGPLALTISDLFTISIYFSVAGMIL